MSRRAILMYHRVSEDPDDPYQLCVSPSRFREQLDCLRSFADVVPLRVLLSARGRRPMAAITFDDGYADNLILALPIAAELGITFTVFVTSGVLGSPQGFWWDRLVDIVRTSPHEDGAIDLRVGENRIRIAGMGAGWRPAAVTALHSRLRPLRPPAIADALASLAEQLRTADAVRQVARPLTVDELAELAAHPAVTIGAHTEDHVLLSSLRGAEQHATMSKSRRQLEDVTGRAVVDFAYPFGGREAFNAESVAAARDAGFRTACTTISGRVSARSDRLRLPRLMVFDEPAHAFAGRLRKYGFG